MATIPERGRPGDRRRAQVVAQTLAGLPAGVWPALADAQAAGKQAPVAAALHPAQVAWGIAVDIRFPDVQYDVPWMAHGPPGRTGERVWTFNGDGDFDFACRIAGRYQAGMMGRIRVSPATASQPKGRP